MKFMLDTNTCIYIIKRKPPEVIKRFKKTKLSLIGISSITFSELLYGVSKSSKPEKNQVALAQVVAPLVIPPYGDEAAQNYGDLRAYLVILNVRWCKVGKATVLLPG
jgi:tRNA(fMet)-specific endonuclease VapC